MGKIHTEFDHEGTKLPVNIYIESRRGMRISFGKDNLIVRIPKHISRAAQSEHLQKAKTWIVSQLKTKPALIEQYKIKKYDGSEITLMDRTFVIKVAKEERKSGRIDQKGSYLIIKVPTDLPKRDESILIKKLLSKSMASVFKSKIIRRVKEINEQYFQKNIKSVNLKYNKSNWGSCSIKTNINLSTRLLLVPEKVRDYVIIHELAHLIEMNHSKRFWDIVESVCPDYKIHEKWLDVNGPNVDF